VNLETPLAKLGIDSFASVEIQLILERDFETPMPPSVMRSLSIRQLQEKVDSQTEENLMIDNSSESNWFGIAYNVDESRVHETMFKANEIEDESVTRVLIIPGIVGEAENNYFNLAKNLKFPTFILNLHKTAKCTEFDQVMQMLSADVRKLYEGFKQFILVCHSFGSAICLKLAGMLEEQGKIGHVVFIDGSPEWCLGFLGEMQTDNKRSNFEDLSVKFLTRVLSIDTSSLSSKHSWDEKVQELYTPNKKAFQVSFEYFKDFMDAIVNRMVMITKFNEITFPVLRSHVTLLKASKQTVKNIKDDFGLQSLSEQPISIRTLEGSHSSVIINANVHEILNIFD
jgi:thioesterase domain-containing protein